MVIGPAGQLAERESCKNTELKRCSMTEMRWNNHSNRIVIITIIMIIMQRLTRRVSVTTMMNRRR